MAWPYNGYVPLIMPWADTRPIAGESTGFSGTWYPGVFASWPEAMMSGTGFGAMPPWGNPQWTTPYAAKIVDQVPIYRLIAPKGTGTINVPANGYLAGQGIENQSPRVCVPAIVPLRPLAADPIAVDQVDGGVAVTLGGITARNTHSQRRHWVLDLLLDGPLDALQTKLGVDDRVGWPWFLRWFEKGITVYLWHISIGGTAILYDPQGTGEPPYFPAGEQYFGSPTRITGQLVDCTSVRWEPGVGERMMRYTVTMTIAEQLPPGRLS